MLIFLSDNGASSEILPQVNMEHFRRRTAEVPGAARDGSPMRIGNQPSVFPGASDTYASYGPSWANVSNTPFRISRSGSTRAASPARSSCTGLRESWRAAH